MQVSTIRPGLFVALSTVISGNVAYRRKDIEADHWEEGTKVARWETERTIFDPAEHERATIVRSKARSLISGVCARSAMGLLCPESKAQDLDAAIAEARRIVEEFNDTATLSRVSLYVPTFRVEQNDVEAVRAINAEVRQLIDAMANGVSKLDVDAVRRAANEARSLSGMLSDDAKERVAVAIKTARDAARKIVQAGEQAAQEIDRAAIRKIEAARTAFLDLDEQAEVAAPEADARAIDLTPSAEEYFTPYDPNVAALDAEAEEFAREREDNNPEKSAATFVIDL